MINLSKINVSDKVSAWINVVNNIIDTIKLAVAPSVNEEGELTGGNDGYLSKEDKKKIDDLDVTYMPINGSSSSSATWRTNVEEVTNDSFFVTIESPDVMVVNTSGACTIDVVQANVSEYSEKTIYLTAVEETTLTVTGMSSVNFGSAGDKLLLKIVFIGGEIFTYSINK